MIASRIIEISQKIKLPNVIPNINIKVGLKIEDYKVYGSLNNLKYEFLENTKKSIGELEGCTIWMINSTAIGGGVAEMLQSPIQDLVMQGARRTLRQHLMLP